MRLCKALLTRSARPNQYQIISPTYLGRRYFADRPSSPSKPHTIQDEPSSHGELSSNREDVFKINPENKTVETVVGELPLSPVMDPTFWEATRRHQLPKAKPGKPQNSVERQLRANPFAKALATPVRMCAVTRARLPSFFLQDFNLVAHPETSQPWLIPRDLIPDEPSAPEASIAAPTKDVEDPDSTPTNTDRAPHGPAAYVLARRDVLNAFATKQSGLHKTPNQITGANLRQKNLAGDVVWRQDMDAYILHLLRESIADDIIYLSRLCADENRYYIAKCYGWGDVRHKHKGAVLWFGPDEESTSAPDDVKNAPGVFATYEVQKQDTQGEVMTTSVAVHNMPMLLGPEQARRVKEEAAVLRDGFIFMLAGRRTAELQMKLWKLQGYVEDYRDM